MPVIFKTNNSYFKFYRNNSKEFNCKSIQDLLNQLSCNKFSFNDFIFNKEKIKILVNNSNESIENINSLLHHLMLLGLNHDFKAFFHVLTEIFNLDVLQKVTKAKLKDEYDFDSALDLASKIVKDYPNKSEIPAGRTFKSKFTSEFRKFRPLALYFIPNLINLFFDAFNFIDVYENYTTLWEKQLIFDILYKFMFVPGALLKILEPILIVPIKIYTAAAGIFFSIGLLASVYTRLLKPIPSFLVNCQNLDRQFELGHVKKKVGDTAVMKKVVSALMAGCNVLLVGKSGEGKTGLVHQLVQYKSEGKLDKKLAKLKNFSLNCSLLMGHGSFSHAEMLQQTRKKMKGNEKNILMFFDEVDQLTGSAFQSFKEAFLYDDQKNPLIIAATTYVGLEKIQSLDKDGSFMQRVVKIEVESAEDAQCKLMINEFLNRNAELIPIKQDKDEIPEVTNALLTVSKSSDYLPDIGRLAKIKKIMKIALGRCLWTYSEKNYPKELIQAKEEYEILLNDPCHLRNKENLKKRRELREKIQGLEKIAGEERQKIKRIQNLMKAKQYFQKESCVITKQILEINSLNTKTGMNLQKQFYLSQIFNEEWMRTIVENEISKVKDSEIELNANLIYKIFNELKKTG